MKTIQPKHLSKSKTIAAIQVNERIQMIVIGLGVVSFGAWAALPSSLQAQIEKRAVPVLTAAMFGGGLAAKWYNSKAKDGRIDVGDLFTDDDDGLPFPAQAVASTVLSDDEQSALAMLQGLAGFNSRSMTDEVTSLQLDRANLNEAASILQEHDRRATQPNSVAVKKPAPEFIPLDEGPIAEFDQASMEDPIEPVNPQGFSITL